MKTISRALVAVGLAATLLASGEEDAERVKMAGQVLGEIEAAPDKSIPDGLFHKASCIIVIPAMKKAGFIVSAKYGRGYASCRKPGGGWTGPAGMRIEGGGFGLQVGGSATDVVMLVMSKRGMDGLLSSKFTLGGEASIAAGPVGRDATAQTDATMQADILSWSRSRGVFGGLSLQGGTLRPDEDANKAIYPNMTVTSRDILTGKVQSPVGSDPFITKVVEFGGQTPAK